MTTSHSFRFSWKDQRKHSPDFVSNFNLIKNYFHFGADKEEKDYICHNILTTNEARKSFFNGDKFGWNGDDDLRKVFDAFDDHSDLLPERKIEIRRLANKSIDWHAKNKYLLCFTRGDLVKARSIIAVDPSESWDMIINYLNEYPENNTRVYDKRDIIYPGDNLLILEEDIVFCKFRFLTAFYRVLNVLVTYFNTKNHDPRTAQKFIILNPKIISDSNDSVQFSENFERLKTDNGIPYK